MTAEEAKAGPAMRCRMRFEHRGDAAGFSHLEQIKELRAMVAGSGLEYYGSKGPGEGTPKMAFGPAAGAGHASLCEYADAWFARLYREDELRSAFASAPRGLALSALRRVPLLFPSIEASAAAARFELRFSAAPRDAERLLSGFMAAAEFRAEREKKGEKVVFDLRPAVISAEWDGSVSALRAVMRTRAGGKPEILVSALFGPDAPAFTVLRTGLYWEDSAGNLREIL